MKIIVGLGNPGEKYKNNRHNVGAQFIDYMATWLHGHLVKKTSSYLTIQPSNHSCFLLVKLQTFMNLSGTALEKLIENYKLKIENLIVTHDDLDIPLGKFKIQRGVGPKLHNGLESIEKILGTKNFWRIRIGVDNRQENGWLDGESYVLQDFRKEEKNTVIKTFPSIFQQLQKLVVPTFGNRSGCQ